MVLVGLVSWPCYNENLLYFTLVLCKEFKGQWFDKMYRSSNVRDVYSSTALNCVSGIFWQNYIVQRGGKIHHKKSIYTHLQNDFFEPVGKLCITLPSLVHEWSSRETTRMWKFTRTQSRCNETVCILPRSLNLFLLYYLQQLSVFLGI